MNILEELSNHILVSTNNLIHERKQHNQNYYESIVRHRELLLLYNDINETNDVTEEQMKRYEELMRTINNEKILDSLSESDKKELKALISFHQLLNPRNKSKTVCRVCYKVDELIK